MRHAPITRASCLIPHPSSLIPHHSSLITHHSPLTPHHSLLIPRLSCLMPHASCPMPHASSLMPHQYTSPMFPRIPPPPQRLLVFARLPERGRVKTRLAREVGEERALAIYEAMLRDALQSIGDSTTDTEVEVMWVPTP